MKVYYICYTIVYISMDEGVVNIVDFNINEAVKTIEKLGISYRNEVLKIIDYLSVKKHR